MFILLSLLLTILAGFINGSYPAPTKYMPLWTEELRWLVFCVFGMLLLPWLTALILVPEIFTVLHQVPNSVIYTIMLGGLIFGIGQICSAVAFKLIGIGLNFVINISVGTACTALVGLFMHRSLIDSTYGMLQIFGVMLFVIAVVLGAYAGAQRDKHKRITTKAKATGGLVLLGIVLCLCAGIGSGVQGVVYTITNPTVVGASAPHAISGLAANTIAWILLFTLAFVPYSLYFLVLAIKRRHLKLLAHRESRHYWLFAILMGVGFWGSLILFSGANAIIGGDLGPTVVWPLFMVFIILTSNLWSVVTGEWTQAGKKAHRILITSVLLLVVAIGVFSASAVLKPLEQPVTVATLAQ